MLSSAVCEVHIEPDSPPAVVIQSSSIHGGGKFHIVLDDRTTAQQRGMLFSRGMEAPDSLPSTIRGYALLMNNPVLIVEVVVPNESAWLLFDWNDEKKRASAVVVALGPDNTESLFAMRVKKAAEQAITIYRTFYD